jgi:hypothetical protein
LVVPHGIFRIKDIYGVSSTLIDNGRGRRNVKREKIDCLPVAFDTRVYKRKTHDLLFIMP